MNRKPIRCELISWDEVQELALEVANRIRQSGFQPDLIVAVARGGFVPARLLCDYLRVYELASIRVEHYAQGALKKPTARLKIPLSIDISGRRVLIVDDVCDSGDTYRVAFDHIRDLFPAEVRTAALQHKIGASYEPEFVARQIHEWRWLIYPWAVTEDAGGFIEQMEKRPRDIGELKERLFDEHGIRLSSQRLRDILALLDL